VTRPSDDCGHHDLPGGSAADCQECRTRRAGWQNLAGATAIASDALVGALRTPSFDDLVGPHLTSTRPVEVPGPGLRAAWRLVVALTGAQLRLLPRALAPLSLLGFAAAVGLAAAPLGKAGSTALFGLAVTLVIQLGTLTTCSGRAGPAELFATVPVGPAVVFAHRLTLVLAADTVLALGASLVASGLGVATVPDLVGGWLGQAMLASAIGLVVAVWRSPASGAMVGVAVWALAALGTFSGGGPLHRLVTVLLPLWSSGPLPLLVALALIAVAVLGAGRVRFPGLAS
jgi:hypothetical protein